MMQAAMEAEPKSKKMAIVGGGAYFCVAALVCGAIYASYLKNVNDIQGGVIDICNFAMEHSDLPTNATFYDYDCNDLPNFYGVAQYWYWNFDNQTMTDENVAYHYGDNFDDATTLIL